MWPPFFLPPVIPDGNRAQYFSFCGSPSLISNQGARLRTQMWFSGLFAIGESSVPAVILHYELD